MNVTYNHKERLKEMAKKLGELRRSGLTQILDINLSVSTLDSAARKTENPLSQGHLVQIYIKFTMEIISKLIISIYNQTFFLFHTDLYHSYNKQKKYLHQNFNRSATFVK